MSAQSSLPPAPGSLKDSEKAPLGEPDVVLDGISVAEGKDILALQDTDPALNAKMHIVNNVRERAPQAPRSKLQAIEPKATSNEANIDSRQSTKLGGRIITGSCSCSMDLGKINLDYKDKSG
jgi:hypothetical protein